MKFIIYLLYHPAAWEKYRIERKEKSLAGKLGPPCRPKINLNKKNLLAICFLLLQLAEETLCL